MKRRAGPSRTAAFPAGPAALLLVVLSLAFGGSSRAAAAATDPLPAEPDPGEASSMEIIPELRWAGNNAALSFSGRVLNIEAGAWTLEPKLQALMRRGLIGALGGSLSLHAGTERWSGRRSTRVESTGLLVAGSSQRAVWAGAGAARLVNAGRWSTSGVYRAGGTVQFGRTRVSLLSQGSRYSTAFSWIDTIYTPGDSLPPRPRFNREQRRYSYSDNSLEMLWEGDRLGLGIDLNFRVGRKLRDPRLSAAATGSYRLSPRMTLVARGGRNPSIPDQGLPSHNFATMAVQLDLQNIGEKSYPLHEVINEPVRPSFFMQSLAGDLRRIRIRLAGATTLEIAGDFTDWQPLDLKNRGLDTWEVECRIPPGLHRANIRIDGGVRWIPPPGVQTLEDEFSGLVGVFIAP